MRVKTNEGKNQMETEMRKGSDEMGNKEERRGEIEAENIV